MGILVESAIFQGFFKGDIHPIAGWKKNNMKVPGKMICIKWMNIV
jgi:hypothetical protein